MEGVPGKTNEWHFGDGVRFQDKRIFIGTEFRAITAFNEKRFCKYCFPNKKKWYARSAISEDF